ncbi:uncharacterized protein BT62DRAFT_1005152 [Guyanagaster necrorhizus]|uniref:Uncharacterized protein n=1 Tax=Guyanagaster necrorhizus TaxID=856835 RepID=A0A9P7VVR4_9AGAR|nr:uncharacterized protein BT62DRAFT_1005152 [Guyanagaster necrorhizus MCA 3950]KAG7446771.1 hypothetical protein BT62DRAFT_1005152 [Guyanagaster necrorhizus MCA 3950]
MTPIQAFFARNPEFSYDQSKETIAQFHDMARQLKWKKATRCEALRDIQAAMEQQFKEIYGGSVDDLHAWQRLCEVVGRQEIPNDIEACKAVIEGVHVNIWDLVDYPAMKVPPPMHATETALSKYTRSSGKFYPRRDAHGLLKVLLRNILNPSRKREGTGSGAGRRGGSE